AAPHGMGRCFRRAISFWSRRTRGASTALRARLLAEAERDAELERVVARAQHPAQVEREQELRVAAEAVVEEAPLHARVAVEPEAVVLVVIVRGFGGELDAGIRRRELVGVLRLHERAADAEVGLERRVGAVRLAHAEVDLAEVALALDVHGQ